MPRLAPPALVVAALAVLSGAIEAQSDDSVTVDLGGLAERGALRIDGREASLLVEGGRRGAYLGVGRSFGVAWIDGVTFSTGTIELDVRGRDLQSQSFLGVAFGALGDPKFETVYVRPFNFRTGDPSRRAHAVQYESMPEYPWSRLRSEFPEVYENPVDPPPDPADWVRLRIVVEPGRIEAFVGEGAAPDLVVDRIDPGAQGRVGLWVGTLSDGSFANLRILGGSARR
jgi:hypothetical protein